MKWETLSKKDVMRMGRILETRVPKIYIRYMEGFNDDVVQGRPQKFFWVASVVVLEFCLG